MTRLSKFFPPFLLGTFFVALFLAIPGSAWAQAIHFDMGAGPTTTARMVQTVILVTVLALAPSILVMVTSYTRIIVVLSFLRTALGTQTTPPNIVLISLALFLTMFIMQPTLDRAWENGVQPLMNNEIDEGTSFERTMEPLKEFMLKNTRPKDLALFVEVSKASDAASLAKKPANEKAATAVAKEPDQKDKEEAKEDISTRAMIPAFMISELRRAFEIGFLIFLPFLIIDMVIASLLMSMGMMMLPPSIISLPFKVVFFVLVDGWYLICGSLIKSYGVG